jgi:ferredoxin-NADP reductase
MIRMTEMIATKERLRWKPGRIIEIIAETSRTKSLIVEVPGWEGHRPGQHVDVRLTVQDGYKAQRSYSIASPPEDRRITLVVARSHDGEVSPYLIDELRVGDRLDLRGPIGCWSTWEADVGSPLLLVAGGSGIVSLMAMIRHRAAVGSDVPTRLLYSSRSLEDAIYRDELDHLARTDEALEVKYTFTRVQPSGWTGYRRRIDKEMLGEVAWRPEEKPLAFVCGPTPLVQTVATGLVTLGYEPTRIRMNRKQAT